MMKSYLGGAASVQNRGAKPSGQSRRERSQGGAVMCRREEAGSLDLAGGHLSRNEGRVSHSRTKPSLLVPRSSWRTTNAVRSPGGTVLPALMPGKGSVSLTDEVPRSSSLPSITSFYKALPKGSRYAPAAGTATPWPRPQGCLQRHSTSSGFDVGKAKPQSDSRGSASSWDKLASAKQRSLTPGFPRRTVPPRGEKSCPVGVDSPFLGAKLCPSQEPHAPACGRGRPVREIRSLAKYEESTSLRQRGGGGFGLPLTHRNKMGGLELERLAAEGSDKKRPADFSTGRGTLSSAVLRLFDLVAHPVALAFNDDRLGVMQKAIQDSGG